MQPRPDNQWVKILPRFHFWKNELNEVCSLCDCAVNTLFWFQVPPALSGHCEYSAAGYSVKIVWKKPPGMWTAVEVNVSGRTFWTKNQEDQDITVSGFQPATTYQVSLAALSGTVRRSEPSVFPCPTDPRGKSRSSLLGFTNSKQWLSGLTGTPSGMELWCLLAIWFLCSGVIAGSVVAVPLLGVLICIAVLVYHRRLKIFRLVLPLWLRYSPWTCSNRLFFTTAGKHCLVVAPNSRVKSQGKSIPVSRETSDIICTASWRPSCVFQGHFCCNVLQPLPQTEWEWAHGFRRGIWGAYRNKDAVCFPSLTACKVLELFSSPWSSTCPAEPQPSR